MTSLMDTLARHESERPASFRAVFAEARREMVSRTGMTGTVGDRDGQAARSFEVRIEKRRGRRIDESCWNDLGWDGWELVAVTGKHAYFRRERRI